MSQEKECARILVDNWEAFFELAFKTTIMQSALQNVTATADLPCLPGLEPRSSATSGASATLHEHNEVAPLRFLCWTPAQCRGDTGVSDFSYSQQMTSNPNSLKEMVSHDE